MPYIPIYALENSYLFKRETERAGEGREKEKISALLVQGPMQGLKLQTMRS